jgi:Ni/Fe-hydrogenase subunit HybB-like protein
MAIREPKIVSRFLIGIFTAFMIIGALAFIIQASGDHPEKAWQAYLINFLLFSAISQGGLLFSIAMNTAKARWSYLLSGVSESFAAFFPVSFGLFLFLFLGRIHVFPWLGKNLHGKEVWLNLPFLFTRDIIGITLLYGLGFAYLYNALWFKMPRESGRAGLSGLLSSRWRRQPPDSEKYRRRMMVYGNLYILAFALVLSLIGFDLVMSMDPEWYSTLFGAYSFIKAFYVGLGAVIILASVLHLHPKVAFTLPSSNFHDIGKLFFAFCMLWGDFFYVQLVVIWYGNISEETAYVIQRTQSAPWNVLAWTVFVSGFILPFLILLNKRFKTLPKAMIALCAAVIVSMWMEHFLILGPIYSPDAVQLPLQISDVLISLGFLGLMAASVAVFLNQFPELLSPQPPEASG